MSYMWMVFKELSTLNFLIYITIYIYVYVYSFFKLVSVCLNYLVRLFALITVETSMDIMYISSSILN